MKPFPHGSEPTFKELIEEDQSFDPDAATPFAFLHPDPRHVRIEATAQAIDAADALGNAMVEQESSGEDADSTIPPIYTYWSQFLDHELTARTDRDSSFSVIVGPSNTLNSFDPDDVVANLLNRRTPNLDLDALYGSVNAVNEPQRGYQMRFASALREPRSAFLRTGMNIDIGSVTPPINSLSLRRDLPRLGQIDQATISTLDDPDIANADPRSALIGDPRNDENLLVAQFHTALLHFHNEVVRWLQRNDPVAGESADDLFGRAQKVVRWSFQWLTLNDFLKTILVPNVVDQVMGDGALKYRAISAQIGEPFMPLEFSIGAYRFGHSMIRDAYDYNRNFGRGAVELDRASLPLLFAFTGGGGFPLPADATALPSNWIVEWDRFVAQHDVAEEGGLPGRFARRIDTRLAEPLRNLNNEGADAAPGFDFQVLLKHLARRNLRRSLILSTPCGQAMATLFGLVPLSSSELRRDLNMDMQCALEQGDFLRKTPLWFYILREAELAGGNHLGLLGSHIVSETFVGALLDDQDSYLSTEPDWHPGRPVPGATTQPLFPQGMMMRIEHLLNFAQVL